jgi:multidrug efflux system outer membrane protein
VAVIEPKQTNFAYALDEMQPVVPNWWQQFNDPILISLVERALQENRSLQAAQANLSAADALFRRAELERSFDAGSASDLSVNKNTRVSDINASLSGGLTAVWEYDLFGGIDAQVRSAQLNREAVLQSKRDIAVVVAAQTAQAYVDLRGAQQRLAVAEASVVIQSDSLDLLRELADAGRSNDLDLNRAESLFLTTRASLPGFRANVQTAKARLAVLTAIEVAEPRPLMGKLNMPGEIPRHEGALGIGTPSELIRRRPDIRAAEARIAENLALSEAERARLFPRLTFNASLSTFFGSLGDLGDVNSLGFGIGPGISWEGPDLRRVRADIDVSDALTRAAVANYEQAVFSALSDVESALALYSREMERRADLVGAVTSAKNALRLARLRFKEGLDDFLDVLDAQRTLLETRDDLVQNDIAITTFAISVYRALGGMWTEAELEKHQTLAQRLPKSQDATAPKKSLTL